MELNEMHPTSAEALVILGSETTRKGTSKFTTPKLQDALGITKYNAELKPHLEDLVEFGLVENLGHGHWALTPEGRAAISRAGAHPGARNPSDSTSPSRPSPVALPRLRSTGSERNGSVKSSATRSDKSLDSTARLNDLVEEASQAGRIKRKDHRLRPESNAGDLVEWFRREVEDILVERGIGMAGAVPVGAATGMVKRWRDEDGIPLATIKVAMEKFLAQPTWANNWVKAAKEGKEPWWSFYGERNAYLSRAKGVSSKSDQGDTRLSEESLTKWGLTADDLAPLESDDVVRPADEG